MQRLHPQCHPSWLQVVLHPPAMEGGSPRKAQQWGRLCELLARKRDRIRAKAVSAAQHSGGGRLVLARAQCCGMQRGRSGAVGWQVLRSDPRRPSPPRRPQGPAMTNNSLLPLLSGRQVLDLVPEGLPLLI